MEHESVALTVVGEERETAPPPIAGSDSCLASATPVAPNKRQQRDGTKRSFSACRASLCRVGAKLLLMAEPISEWFERAQRPSKTLLTFGTRFYDDLFSQVSIAQTEAAMAALYIPGEERLASNAASVVCGGGGGERRCQRGAGDSGCIEVCCQFLWGCARSAASCCSARTVGLSLM